MIALALSLALVPLLAVPPLVVLAMMEASTPSPVYYDWRACKFRRRALWGDAKAQAAQDAADAAHAAYLARRRDAAAVADALAEEVVAARAGALSEEDAALAVALQLSMETPAAQDAYFAARAREDGAVVHPGVAERPADAAAAPAALNK